MDHAQYTRLAEECLERAAIWLEEFDPDEVDFTSADGVLKIEFPDGTTFVLNRQAAAQQMWFAAGARAWHYGLAEDLSWHCTRDKHEIWDRISQAVSEKLGRTVHI